MKTALTIDPLVIRYRQYARIVAIVPMVIGTLTLIGWFLKVEFLIHPFNGSAAMNVASATCFVLLSVGVLFFSFKSEQRYLSLVIRILIFIPVMVGLLRLFEWAFGAPFSIDGYLTSQLRKPVSDVDRMTLNAGGNFVLCGVSLLLLDLDSARTRWTSNLMLLIAGLISLFSVMGYVYQVEEFYKVFRFYPMTLQSGICFLLICLAIVFLNINGGYMRVITSQYAGGILARTLIPATILIPVFLGYLRLYLAWHYQISPELGVTMLVSSIVIVFFALVVNLADRVNDKDKQRIDAENKLKHINEGLTMQVADKTKFLTSVFEGIPDGFLSLDKDFRYTYANQKIGEMTGMKVADMIGKNVWELFPQAVGSPTYKAFHRAVADQQYIHNLDFYEPLDLYQENHIYPYSDGLFVFVVDVSERKRAERQQALLAAIVESSDEAIISKNLDGIVTSWNQGAEGLFGYKRSEILGKSIMVLIPPDRHSEERAIIDRIKKGERIFHYETVRMRKDGSLVDISITVSPIRDAEGNIVGASKLARNIGDRKLAEREIIKLNDELRRSRQKFIALIDESEEIVTLHDANYKTLYRSANYKRITGWDIAEVESFNPVTLVHEDDFTYIQQVMKDVLATPGKVVTAEFRYRHKDGHYLWMESSTRNLLNDPDIQGIVSNLRDMTDRKNARDALMRSEKIYRSIAANIPGSAICIFDRDYRFSLVEGDLMGMLGYDRDVLIGKVATTVMAPDRTALLIPDLEKSFKGEKFIVMRERIGFDVMTKFVPLRDEDGNIESVMTVSIDVTELRNVQRELNRINGELEQRVTERTEQLQRVNEELEAFTYSVSHDLRSPLRAVNGFARMLEEDYGGVLDENGHRLISTIANNGRRMSMLIDDLLAFSRLGRKEVQKHHIDMNDLVRRTLDEINKNSSHKARIVLRNLHPATGDASLLKQVFLNYLQNALKYSSRKDNPVIEVRSFLDEDKIVYAVRDNGAGFEMAYVHKLFGVFQRLHSLEEYEGTGVGLATVKRIIKKHGGDVWAEGEVDVGSTFYFSLPLDENVLMEHEKVNAANDTNRY